MKILTETEVEEIFEGHEDILTVDGFNDCIIGICERFDQEDILAYSKDAVVLKLMKRDGMSAGDAYEYFYFNIIGAGMGELTPCFIE